MKRAVLDIADVTHAGCGKGRTSAARRVTVEFGSRPPQRETETRSVPFRVSVDDSVDSYKRPQSTRRRGSSIARAPRRWRCSPWTHREIENIIGRRSTHVVSRATSSSATSPSPPRKKNPTTRIVYQWSARYITRQPSASWPIEMAAG